MDDSLEAVRFLTGSPNRLRMLLELAAGPRTSQRLEAEVDVPRSSLLRILAEFERRGWVAETDREYRTTPVGDLLVAEMRGLTARLEGVLALGQTVQLLPVDEFDFDVRRLADATVSTPTRENPFEAIDRIVEVVGEVDRFTFVSRAVSREVFQSVLDAARDRDQTVCAVLTGDVVDAVADAPDLARWLGDLREAGAEVRRYDGDPSVILAVADDRVLLHALDEDGIPQALFESRDDAVREWATSQLARYRQASSPLDAGG